MQKNVYFHSVGFLPPRYYYDPEDKRIILESILSSGEILSMRNQGRNSNGGFCGADYISLCDYEKRFYENGRKGYNGYRQYIIDSISLALDKEKVQEEVKVIKPELVENCTFNRKGYMKMEYLGECETRYSDLPDEVQVKDRLSLNGLVYVTFPTTSFNYLYIFRSKKKRIQLLKDEVSRVRELLDKYNYDVDIYDIETLDEMSDENIERLILKR